MPIVTIQVTDEGVSHEQKAELIKRSTDMLSQVLNKDPQTTFVLIEEIALENWGVAGITAKQFRQLQQNQ
ncbi:4-oxalocrotonate tautomerase [Saccharobesus litoralis]|uniref:Tautomerase n=1 Tax=Saccharobesus litoralis TaxID=2172099 RepID=A0A2S0VNW1_9ALTE|nr:4-oxalocrotonate tautomerase family protein [Saccharobesus litoralis]AWB65898.1 4-oxalocrotonate tautomerase [Saccharobesus litoralis]